MTKFNQEIWAEILAARPNAVTAREAATVTRSSLAFTRKLLRLWASAGLIDRHATDSTARDASDSFSARFDAPRMAPVIRASGEVTIVQTAMTPQEFAAIRRQAGHTLSGMGRALGWTGKQPSISRAMKAFETGARRIDASLAAKISALIE